MDVIPETPLSNEEIRELDVFLMSGCDARSLNQPYFLNHSWFPSVIAA